ncbi:uncharacterized protein LOC129600326 [Paramacrobiotus metropolitanus]|uniref:uncharacterized protein LOC129600326 n=1 Tax=Paramacrobiotus metropolitanus TaxID=2943436 RepID=UPI002445F135|nr:uncharacterized protein LOC129600326 [Paramacrobiotus metropolitanus]
MPPSRKTLLPRPAAGGSRGPPQQQARAGRRRRQQGTHRKRRQRTAATVPSPPSPSTGQEGSPLRTIKREPSEERKASVSGMTVQADKDDRPVHKTNRRVKRRRSPRPIQPVTHDDAPVSSRLRQPNTQQRRAAERRARFLPDEAVDHRVLESAGRGETAKNPAAPDYTQHDARVKRLRRGAKKAAGEQPRKRRRTRRITKKKGQRLCGTVQTVEDAGFEQEASVARLPKQRNDSPAVGDRAERHTPPAAVEVDTDVSEIIVVDDMDEDGPGAAPSTRDAAPILPDNGGTLHNALDVVLRAGCCSSRPRSPRGGGRGGTDRSSGESAAQRHHRRPARLRQCRAGFRGVSAAGVAAAHGERLRLAGRAAAAVVVAVGRRARLLPGIRDAGARAGVSLRDERGRRAWAANGDSRGGSGPVGDQTGGAG